MAPTTRGENVAENDAFAGPNNAGGEKPSASLTPWVIVAITAASFLAVTFVGFVGVTLMRRRQRHRQRLGANAAAAVKQHNSKYYYRKTHSRKGSFERPWPSLSKGHYQQQPEEVAELQRSQLIGKARASRESWSSYGGSVMMADATTYLPEQQPPQQSSFSSPHAYTAVSAHDHHHHQQHPVPSSSTTGAEGTSASRSHGPYRYDDCDSEEDEEREPAPKKSMSPSDWKELEAQTGRIRSSSLQDPATLGRGHPAFSPELGRAPLPAKLPRTLVVTDVVGRRAVT
ncbi:uncharacterized protein PG986_012460 [Apiospora aurea]|uniref:Transmembrane protein n=1 Tax=Apiospora aurea TaxID=335848 RepID=A0ABR1Q019_9PEZI